MMIEIGTKQEMTWVVAKKDLASSFGSGLADVLATPVLVGFCEECCRMMIDPDLADGEQTVGTKICINHLSATPCGMRVTVRASLAKIDGRSLHFEFEARDEIEKIADGAHTRFIIDSARFQHRIAEKRQSDQG